jgi:hypothetical protein
MTEVARRLGPGSLQISGSYAIPLFAPKVILTPLHARDIVKGGVTNCLNVAWFAL